MKDSRKSSRVPPAPAADLRQAKSLLPKDRPARVGFKPKSSSLSNAVRSKNHLAWYVALNKHSEKKIPHIPQIKWKCPPKFALNTDWRVAAGEESQDAEAQKCRECECHDDSQTPIIPLIPMEEAAAEMPFDTSVTVNARINPQPPASCSSVSADIPLSQADPSESQDQSVIGKSLPSMLHGLKSRYLEIAAVTAATVAAVMQSKDRVDPELLIKFLSDPEMIKKMMRENGFTSKPEDKAPSEPKETTCSPLPSLTPASAVDKLDNGGDEPASKATTCSPLPSLTPASAVDKRDNGGNELASKATTCSPLPSLTPASAVDKLDNGGNEPTSTATTCLPLPSLTPASAVDNGGNEPVSKAMQSNSIPEPVKKSPLPTEINKVASKVGGARAGSGRIHTSNAVKGPSHSPRFNSDGPTKTLPQISRQQNVRPLVRSVLRPHEESTIDRLVKKYGGPDIASVKPIGPLNSSPSMLNLEVAKKMIHNYGAADVARVKPMAPLAASPSMPLPSLLPCHGRRQPFVGPSPSLLSSTASSPMTNLLRSRVDATDYVMLQAIDIPLDGDDAVELYKFCAKKDQGPAKAAVATAKGNASFELPPPSTQPKKKRVVEVDTSDCSNDNITLTFPSSASAYSNFGPHADEVKKLLFPKDKETFEQLGAATVGQSAISHAFQGVQIMIYLTKKVAELGGQAEVLRAEVVALRAEHKTLMSRKMEAERLADELQEKLNLRDLDASRLQSALSEVEFLKAQVAESDKMMCRAARNAEIKVRAEMLDDYLNGRASSWNVDKIYADREELERIMATEAVPTNEQGEFHTYDQSTSEEDED